MALILLITEYLVSRESVAGVSVNDERFVKAAWASGLADEIKSARM